MADKKSTLIFELKSNTSEFTKGIQKAINESEKLEAQFGNIGTDSKALNRMLKMANKINSILNTKVSDIGNIDTKDAKELRDTFADLQALYANFTQSNSSRKGLKEFNNSFKEVSATIDNLSAKIAELEKQRNVLANNKKTVLDFVDDKTKGVVTKNSGTAYSKTEVQTTEIFKSLPKEEQESVLNIYDKASKSAKETKAQIDALNEEIKASKQLLSGAEIAKRQLLNTGVKSEIGSTAIFSESNNSYFANMSKNIDDNSDKKTINLYDINEKTTNSFNKAAKAILSFSVVLRGLRTVTREAVRTITELDKAFTVMTMVTGKSREEVQAYAKTFKEMAQATSSTMVEMADLTTEFLRQGRSLRDSMVLAQETAKAAKIAGISVGDSIQYMTSTINGFNLAATDAAHVSDVFAKVAVSTATDYEQLAVSLSKVSAQANLAGMSMEFTTSLLAKGIETTQEAPESIGTALKTIVARFRELTDYGKVLEDGTGINKVERALAHAGITLRDTNGQFRELESVFNELGAKWDSLNGMQQQAIAQAAAGSRQQSRFVAIMQDWNRTLEITESAQNAVGESTYEYNQYAKSLSATMTNLTTAWQGFTTSLVDTEFVINILQKLTEFLNFLSNESIGKAIKYIGLTVGGIAGYMKIINLYQENKLRRMMQEKVLYHQLSEEEQTQVDAMKLSNNFIRMKIKNLKEELRLSRLISLEEEKQAYLDSITTKNGTIDKRVSKGKGYSAKMAFFDQQKSILEAGRVTEREYGSPELTGQLEYYTSVLRLQEKNKINYLDILKLNSKNLDDAGQELLLQSQDNTFAKIKLLTLKKESITNKELLAQRTKLLDNIKSQAASLGKMAVVALVVAAVATAIKSIVNEIKAVENAQKAVIENNDKIYENRNKASGLRELVSEYETLSNKINLTAEEQERLNELSRQMKEDYDVTGIESGKKKLVEYSKEIDKAKRDNVEKMNEAFLKGGKEIFEKSEFVEVFNNLIQTQVSSFIDSKIEELGDQLSEVERERAKQIGSTLASNVDRNSIMNDTKVTGVRGKGIGWGTAAGVTNSLIVGSVLSAVLTSTKIGAAIGTAGGPLGTIIGGIVGVAGGIAVGLVTAKKVREEAAEEMAELQIQQQQAQKQIADFSVKMASATSNSFKEMAKVYREASKEFNDIAKEATDLEYGYLKNAEYIEALDMFVKNLGISTDKAQAMMKKLHSYSQDTANSFLEGLVGAVEDGVTDYLRLYEAIYNFDMKPIYEQWRSKNAGIFEIAGGLRINDDGTIYYDNKKDIPKNFDRKGAEIYLREKGVENLDLKTDAQILAEVRSLLKEDLNKNTNVENFKDVLLDAVSPYDNLKSTTDSVTAIKERVKTYNEYLSKLDELEDTQIQEIYSSLGDEQKAEFIEALGAQDLETMGRIIRDLRDATSEYNSEYQSALNRVEVELIDPKITAERKAALEDEKAYYENMISAEESRNKLSLERLYIQRKLSILEKELDDPKKLREYVKLQKEEINRIKNELRGNFKGSGSVSVEEEMELYMSFHKGLITSTQLSGRLNKTNKEVYNTYEAIKEKLDEILGVEEDVNKVVEDGQKKYLDAQEEAISKYKETLEKERDALKDSLDERKKMYDKYFDALDDSTEDEDFEAEQKRLQKAIASLSTATDAASLQRRKEYENELASLESERHQLERERRREAVNENYDNQLEMIDQEYEYRLENERELWEEIKKMDPLGIDKLLSGDLSKFTDEKIASIVKAAAEIKTTLEFPSVDGTSATNTTSDYIVTTDNSTTNISNEQQINITIEGGSAEPKVLAAAIAEAIKNTGGAPNFSTRTTYLSR